MKKVILSAAVVMATVSAFAQTDLNAGNLALVSYNSSNPDVMGFVSLSGFTAGTSFIFTDYGWLSAENTFRFGGEGYIQATATRDFAAGEVFVISAESGIGVTGEGFNYTFDGTATVPQFAPSFAGDGVIVFQGEIDDPNQTWSGELLWALNAEATGADEFGWQTTSTNSNTSGLPAGLTNGFNAIGMVRPTSFDPNWQIEFDNYNYVGIRTGTQAELNAALTDRANWLGQDLPVFSVNTDAFNVTPVPEPATLTVAGVAALLAMARRRRKA